jgi:hypothetical protein
VTAQVMMTFCCIGKPLCEIRSQIDVMLIAMIEERPRLGKRTGDSMKQNVASGTFTKAKQGFSGVPHRGC